MDADIKSLSKDPSNDEGTAADRKSGEPDVTPGRDLGAAVVVAAFSLFVIILALQFPNPGKSRYTAPGLLPILTGLSLLFMAVGLGIRALKAGGAKDLMKGAGRDKISEAIEHRRAFLLIGIIILYVIAVQLVPFEWSLPLGFFVFLFSGYELFSIIMLTLILKIFWRAPLWRCFLVSFLWVLVLANVFRYFFHILLPGLG